MAVEIKKTPSGYEIDGVIYKKLEDAEEHRKELLAGNIGAAPSWAGEKVEYFHRHEDAKSFALFLEEFLDRKSMTISAFAKGVGVTRKAVYDWMGAKAYPEDKWIEAMAHFMGVAARDVKLALMDNFSANNESYLSAITLTPQELDALKRVLRDNHEWQQFGKLVDAVATISALKNESSTVRSIAQMKDQERDVDSHHALQKLEFLIKTV